MSEQDPIYRDSTPGYTQPRGETYQPRGDAYQAPVAQAYQVLPQAVGPGIAPTVAITLLFGLFGLIPASIAADQARQLGLSSGRYWKAFIFTMLAQMGIGFLIYLLMFGGMLSLLFGIANSSSTREDAPYSNSTPYIPGDSESHYPTDDPTSDYPTDTETTSEPETTDSGVITSLPSGTWITVLDSLEKSRYTPAEAVARAGSFHGGYEVQVVDSDYIAGLNPGYYAIAATGFSSKSAAQKACASFGKKLGGGCYPRRIG